MIDISISATPLDIAGCIQRVMSPQCGGIDVFLGTVRSVTAAKPVIRLEFEAYEKMALREMNKIAEEILHRWPAEHVLIHHRTGVLEIGAVSVVIAVACAHRKDAFEACRYAIDTLKQTVPIWKKEWFEDGAVWVGAHP